MLTKRLSVLLTQYDRDKYRPALGALIRAIAGLKSVESTFVVIDNKEAGDWTHEVSGSLVHLGGDNDAGEFSAFDKGVEYLRDAGHATDVYVVATDALLAYGDEFLHLIQDSIIDVVTNLGACAGWMDGFGQPLQIGRFTYDAWMRTSLVFLPAAVLPMVSPLAADLDDLMLFDESAATPFRPEAQVSQNLQNLLVEWLTTNHGVTAQLAETWHSRFELSDETLPFFRRKASAILREHLLSARLQQLGVACYDFRAIRKLSDAGRMPEFLQQSGDETWQWMSWRTAALPTETIPFDDRSADPPLPEPLGVDRDPAPPTLSLHPPRRTTNRTWGERPTTFVLAVHLFAQGQAEAVSFFANRLVPLIRQRYSRAKGLILTDSSAYVDGVDAPGVGTLNVDDVTDTTFAECAGLVVPEMPAAIEPRNISALLRLDLPLIANQGALTRCELVPGEDYVAARSVTEFAKACCELLGADLS